MMEVVVGEVEGERRRGILKKEKMARETPSSLLPLVFIPGSYVGYEFSFNVSLNSFVF